MKFDDVISVKTNKNINCWYLGNEIKYEAEILCLEVIYDDDDFSNDIKILINSQN